MTEPLLRVFLAIPLASVFHYEFQNLFNQIKPGIQGVKWVNLEQVHVTLHFFGDVRESNLEDINSKIQALTTHFPRLYLSLKGIGFFPNKKTPKIIWVGLGGDLPHLVKFQNSLKEIVVAAGFPVEQREFKPHATIGRVNNHHKGAKLSEQRFELFSFPEIETDLAPIDHINLYKSELTPEGARYEILKKFYFDKKS